MQSYWDKRKCFFIRKELNSHRNVLEHQYGRRDVICTKTFFKCAPVKTFVHLHEINCKLHFGHKYWEKGELKEVFFFPFSL